MRKNCQSKRTALRIIVRDKNSVYNSYQQSVCVFEAAIVTFIYCGSPSSIAHDELHTLLGWDLTYQTRNIS